MGPEPHKPDREMPARLELVGITKSFAGLRANDDVALSVAPGEIHALLGENGAGKSTLVKIIYGVQRADAGQMLWEGHEVEVPHPRAARRLGIGMVFQHFSLFDGLSVIENLALGLDGAVDGPALRAQVVATLDAYSLPLDPERPVHTLSVGERQRIEIVRCLLQRPRLLIMDEPTSVLTPQEVERLFALLRQLGSEGCSILYISHKLEEIRALCHRATILRGGRVVARCDPRRETARRLAELMIGSELASVRRRAAPGQGRARLLVEGLAASPGAPGLPLRDVSFTVASGEILGIAGVAGNGQAELLLALSGEVSARSPEMIRLDGRPVGREGPGARRRLGLACVPEERNGHAAVPDLTLAENAILTARQRVGLARWGFLRVRAARAYAAAIVERFGVKARGPGARAGSLSGGNLQKFIMGREIGQRPEVLVVSQPTWGVDAGAAALIHRALLDLAAQGSALVIVSQNLDELLLLCDRLAVLNEGRLSPARPTAGITVEEIGLLMGGVHGGPPRPAAPTLERGRVPEPADAAQA